MLGCSPILDECVSEGDGLRKEILSKTHHFPYTVHPTSWKYQDVQGRAEVRIGIWYLVLTFHRVRYRRLLEMSPYEALYRRKDLSPLY
jgi:hypothetical protein